MQVYNDEIYHYGKIGMKWGKRTGPNIISRAISNKKEHNQSILDARKNLKSASNDLNIKREKWRNGNGRHYNEYIKADHKYSDLSSLANSKTSGEKVIRVVGNTLAMVGGLTLAAYASSKIPT